MNLLRWSFLSLLFHIFLLKGLSLGRGPMRIPAPLPSALLSWVSAPIVSSEKNSSPRTPKTPAPARFQETPPPHSLLNASGSPEAPSGPLLLDSIRSRILASLEFPDELRKKQIQGSVDLILALSEDGSLESVRISKSSGSSELDQLARSAVIHAQPYPVQTKLTLAVPIRFQLL